MDLGWNGWRSRPFQAFRLEGRAPLGAWGNCPLTPDAIGVNLELVFREPELLVLPNPSPDDGLTPGPGLRCPVLALVWVLLR